MTLAMKRVLKGSSVAVGTLLGSHRAISYNDETESINLIHMNKTTYRKNSNEKIR